jgi:hypothetical protein
VDKDDLLTVNLTLYQYSCLWEASSMSRYCASATGGVISFTRTCLIRFRPSEASSDAAVEGEIPAPCEGAT